MKAKHIKYLAVASLATVLAISVSVLGYTKTHAPSSENTAPVAQTRPEAKEPEAKTQEPATSFNKQRLSLDDPTSLWVVVNKKRPLSSSYTPADLTSVASEQLRVEAASNVSALMAAAGTQSLGLKAISGYRPYSRQASLYNAYVAKDGQAQADTYSARPGHSEHQTGLAIDLGNANGSCDLEICFANTAGGKWIAQHAHEYGFTVRYASGKTAITGYQYEPWHIRYVGKDLATQLHSKQQTLEEFFDLPAAPSY